MSSRLVVITVPRICAPIDALFVALYLRLMLLNSLFEPSMVKLL